MAEGRRSSQRYLSGRSKIIGFSGLSTDRHLYVEPGQVEPNLGFPGEKNLPVSSTYYKLITVDNGTTFDRYWQEDTPATLVNGITIFDEGTLVGTANTVSKLNFVGAAVTATASGTISTITVTPVSISTLAPPNPRSGDLWWDSDEGELNVYYQDINSAQWVLANSGIGTTAGGSGGGGGGGANVTVSSNPPGTASNGDLWWDSDVGELYIYYTDGDSNQWVETSGGSETVTISDNPPANPNDGDLWWESDTGSLKIYYNDGDSQQWVDSNAGVLSSLASFTAWSTNSAGIHTTANVGIGTTNVSAVDSNNTATLAVGIVTAHKLFGDGSNLTGVGGTVVISTSAPSNADVGDLWWDSDEGDLLVYYDDGSGLQWVSTNAGATGAQGAQGAAGGGGGGGAGAQGSQGSAGAQGTAGAQGSQGVAGAQGSQGNNGAQGSPGTGAQGAQGATGGAQGAVGAQGHQGFQGAAGGGGGGGAGAQGSQGHQGHQGANGAQGNAGAQGNNGAQGNAGAQGDQGAQGSPGTGAQGTAGAQGSGTGTENKIFQLNSKVEVVDTATGYATFDIDGTESMRVTSGGATIRYLSVGENQNMNGTSGTGLTLGDSGNNGDIIASSATNGLDIQSSASVDIGQKGFPNHTYATFTNSFGTFRTSNGIRLSYDSSGAKVTGDLEITGNILNNSKTYTVTNYLATHYVIEGENDPKLYFARGRTYILNMNASGHPLHIQTVSGQYDPNNLYTTGVTVVGGRETGTITFSVPSNAPDLLYYVCENHSNMNGQIIISDLEAPATIQRNRGKIEILQTVNNPASGDKQDELLFTTGFTDASSSLQSYSFDVGHVDYRGRWFIGPYSGGKTYHGNGLEDGTSLIIGRSYKTASSTLSEHAVLSLNNRSPAGASQLGSIYFSGYQNCFEGAYIRGIPTGAWGSFPNYRATAISFGVNGYGVNSSTTTTMVERFRIAASGALCVNGASNYGSSGQVLTSNGDAPPTWQASSGSSVSRTTANATTSSLVVGASGNITITAAKTYSLLKIQTSAAAWVTLYTDSTSRSNDSSRNQTTDPTPGSGVIAEVITTGAATQIMTPGIIGWNNDGTPSTNVYAKVKNTGSGAGAITVTLHYLPLET